MRMKSKLGMGLLAVFGILVMLFNQPFLSIPTGQVFGIPSILIYLFVIWIAVIITMIWLSKRVGDQ